MTTCETTETKRDLHADLAICSAATSGPWRVTMDDQRPIAAEHSAIILARGGEDSYVGMACEDEDFIAEARTQEQRLSHIEEMRSDVAKWFADNMEDSAVINVKVSVEEASADDTTQESVG
ncbi:hypothetical protein [Paenibacillus sp. Marseille-Q9583]